MDEAGEKGDIREGRSDKGYDDPSDKMWSLYVAEAEKFDKALVESWKGDMEGILIFAGLFSASVTAFIVESYKKLSPDSGDITVALLTQISSQLVAISNGTNLNISSPSPANVLFRPTASVVSVNILWFLSLSLGLLCALSATMVQQCARNYLQLVERRPTPSKRARIRAYLYGGIETFKMRAVIEAIPTLLHVSLFLFIIGLVQFLFPINHHIALIMLIVSTVVGSLYATVTFLPIRFKNCPFQTPLSPTCWNIVQHFEHLWCRFRNYRGDFPILGSLAEVRGLVAMVPSPTQNKRDAAALDWMLESATDDSELEQFFDAVPAFYDPSGRNAKDVLRSLAWSVFHRSESVLQECLMQADVQSPTRRRRAVVCLKALRAAAPKFQAIPMKMYSRPWPHTMGALRTDCDTTISTLAICTTSVLAASVLFHTADFLPSISTVSDKDVADGQLLMKISDQLPVDELATSMMAQGTHAPIVTSKPSADVMRDALRILKSNDVMEAMVRYLKRCRASASTNIGVFFPTDPKFYDFEADGLTRSLDWINTSIIREAEIALQCLRNPHQDEGGLLTDHAVWATSRMLQGLRTKKMREEFWSCGRLMIINTLISELMQCRHDISEHSAFIAETLHRLIWRSVSPNDAYLETQTKFIRLVKDASTPSPDIPPFPFPVVEMLLRVFDEFEHPTSITLAINAIEGNQWLLRNNFPLEMTIQELNVKLSQKAETITSHGHENTMGSSLGFLVACRSMDAGTQ
ncbi:hypothetical protein BD410DRAFT_788338 [Rickenella mellea]|uniref:DUF6535 domain-containing protein n=1 Tax=Rickenella mellea TaxID=50990 RepID=A0A4Y7Q5E8_9AGAM|nr:hypothetical protein BD410DRAFT_788338 [Rickenella mellea]